MLFAFNWTLLNKILKMKKLSIINIDPEILGGTPVFRGTRVPIQALFDCLPYEGIDGFLYGFPTVTREMVEEVLEIAAKKITKLPKKTDYENSTRRANSYSI